MAGHTKWDDIASAAMSPEARQRARRETERMIAEMPLAELRRARELSQAMLATALETTQPEVSKIEHRTDLYLSTLRSYIEAMGGQLDLIARFPEGEIRITQFEQLGPVGAAVDPTGDIAA